MPDDLSKNDLPKDDRFELERRRLIEQVTESVEGTLRRRYTWLAVIASFLIGGGVATVVNNLMQSAKESIIEAKVVHESLKEKAREIDDLADATKKRLGEIDKDIARRKKKADNLLKEIEKNYISFAGLEPELDSLKKRVGALEKRPPPSGPIASLTDEERTAIRVKQVATKKSGIGRFEKEWYELAFTVDVKPDGGINPEKVLAKIEKVVYLLDKKWWSNPSRERRDRADNFEMRVQVWGVTEVKVRIHERNSAKPVKRAGDMNLYGTVCFEKTGVKDCR